MREVVVDTETTGLDPADGHRIIEIGCVELDDHVPTGRTFQHYLNPERQVPADAQRIHGISDAFLMDKPVFGAICDELHEFLGDAPLVIHNAAFDLKFLNWELNRAGRPILPYGRAIDTIEIAKSKIPGARYSLDELCKRFGIDLSGRNKHGALLDAELTARVYLELVGGRQTQMKLGVAASTGQTASGPVRMRQRPRPLQPRLTAAEREAHAAFVAKELGPDALWGRQG
jgi:DNA polymerase III subunit epsilon